MGWIVRWPSFVLLPVWSSWSPHVRGPSTRRQPACILHGVARQSTKGAIYETRLRADRLTLATTIVDFSPSISPHPRDSLDSDRFFSFSQCAVTDLGSRFSYKNMKSSTCAQKPEKSSSTNPSFWNSRLRSRFAVRIHDTILYFISFVSQ